MVKTDTTIKTEELDVSGFKLIDQENKIWSNLFQKNNTPYEILIKEDHRTLYLVTLYVYESVKKGHRQRFLYKATQKTYNIIEAYEVAKKLYNLV